MAENMISVNDAADHEIAGAGTRVAEEEEATSPADGDTGGDSGPDAIEAWPRVHRLAVVGGLMIVALATLSGWLGYRSYETHQAVARQHEFLRVGRQAAINLTTIDWRHADADIQRILSIASGDFYNDFAKRSKPFIDLVKQTQATSQGQVTAAALESMSGEKAHVLLAVSVQSTSAGAAPAPRLWRMRVDLEEIGRDLKVSNVEFVP
jgi:Mce-associated membrane protein